MVINSGQIDICCIELIAKIIDVCASVGEIALSGFKIFGEQIDSLLVRIFNHNVRAKPQANALGRRNRGTYVNAIAEFKLCLNVPGIFTSACALLLQCLDSFEGAFNFCNFLGERVLAFSQLLLEKAVLLAESGEFVDESGGLVSLNNG